MNQTTFEVHLLHDLKLQEVKIYNMLKLKALFFSSMSAMHAMLVMLCFG